MSLGGAMVADAELRSWARFPDLTRCNTESLGY